MIEIEFLDQSRLTDDLVESVVGDFPSCWNVVLPPGFGEERLSEQLGRKLRAHARQPYVAIQGADAVNSTIADFVRALHWQWSEKPTAPKRLHPSATTALDYLLRWTRERERPVVLVLKRFHKVLDSLDKWVLGKLSTEEEARRLRTITISPLPYSDLKKRWESKKHYFTTSEYGRTHAKRVVEPRTREELSEVCRSLNYVIPQDLVDLASKISGGYPEAMGKVLEWWLSRGSPPLRPQVRKELLEYASGLLETFVTWLDPLEDGKFRDCVIDLYHGVDTEQARDAFRKHPWRDVVLDKDGLRSEALGLAALGAALREDRGALTTQSRWYEITDRTLLLYERRQYESVARILGSTDTSSLLPHDRLLRLHADIMRLITGDEGESHLGEDTDSRRLRKAMQDATQLLESGAFPITSGDRSKIESRYSQLEEMAKAINSTGSVKTRLRGRLVDILAGVAGPKHREMRTCLLLLLVKYEAGKAVAGDGSACQFVLFLPEQIFRIWAFWGLGLDYYHAPTGCEDIWENVERAWPSVHGPVRRASPGRGFPSLPVFAYFALATWDRSRCDESIPAPEPTYKDLETALSEFDAVRTGRSHGYFQTNRRERDNFFSLIDRWLNCLLQVCPVKVVREELLSVIEPLPVVSANGMVRWE